MTPRQLPTEPWAASALCADMDQETFTNPGELPTAIAACGHCPVTGDCLSWALAAEAPGVAGGLTQRQRRHMDPADIADAMGPRREIPAMMTDRVSSDAPVRRKRPAETSSGLGANRAAPSDSAPSDIRAENLTRKATPRPAPYVAAIACSDLFVDHTYQRDLDQNRVRRMAVEHFDRALLGVIEVSDRGDGRYAILEGQHRWAAAGATHGVEFHLVCQVHTDLTLAEEATLFREIDRRRKHLTWWDLWKSRRASSDPVVIDIEAITAAAGLSVGPAPKDGTIGSVGALQTIYQRGGRPLLTSTLAVLTAAYRGERDSLDGALLRAIAELLRHHRPGQTLDTDRLVTALAGTVPAQWKARAALLRETTTGNVPALIGQAITAAYNRTPGPKLPRQAAS